MDTNNNRMGDKSALRSASGGVKKAMLALGIVAIAAIAAIAYFLPPGNGGNVDDDTIPPQGDGGILIESPRANETIASPLVIRGSVNGSGWAGFEGQVGTVRLFDENNKELALGILTATGEWMQLPANFETKIFFDHAGNTEGKLVFYNENASGEPERDKTFTLPVKLTDSSAEKTAFKVYFGDNNADNMTICETVVGVSREVPKTSAVARAALEELLNGPTAQEKHAGLFSSIPDGARLQEITIENGVARADFDNKLQEGVGGSCRVLSIRKQITQTLMQFATVKSVVISINGETEEILQP